MPDSPPLSFAEFQVILADMLEVESAQLTPETYFITDLGVDSVRMVEMFLRLEEMGIELAPNLAWSIQTVGEAYQYFLQHYSNPAQLNPDK